MNLHPQLQTSCAQLPNSAEHLILIIEKALINIWAFLFNINRLPKPSGAECNWKPIYELWMHKNNEFLYFIFIISSSSLASVDMKAPENEK